MFVLQIGNWYVCWLLKFLKQYSLKYEKYDLKFYGNLQIYQLKAGKFNQKNAIVLKSL